MLTCYPTELFHQKLSWLCRLSERVKALLSMTCAEQTQLTEQRLRSLLQMERNGPFTLNQAYYREQQDRIRLDTNLSTEKDEDTKRTMLSAVAYLTVAADRFGDNLAMHVDHYLLRGFVGEFLRRTSMFYSGWSYCCLQTICVSQVHPLVYICSMYS